MIYSLIKKPVSMRFVLVGCRNEKIAEGYVEITKHIRNVAYGMVDEAVEIELERRNQKSP